MMARSEPDPACCAANPNAGPPVLDRHTAKVLATNLSLSSYLYPSYPRWSPRNAAYRCAIARRRAECVLVRRSWSRAASNSR